MTGDLDPVPAPPFPSSVAAPRRPMGHEGTQGVGGSCREGHYVACIGCKLDEHSFFRTVDNGLLIQDSPSSHM